MQTAAASKSARFRALLAQPDPALCPAVHDVLSARLWDPKLVIVALCDAVAERCGAEAAFERGAAHQVLKELKATGTTEQSAKMAVASDVQARLVGAQDWIDHGQPYRLFGQ